MKNDLWKRVLYASSKSSALTLGALLTLTPLMGIAHADSNGNLIVEPVKNIDVNWIKKDATDTGKSSIFVSGPTLTIDLSQHPSRQMNANLTITAVSKSAAVASASIEGALLKVMVIAAGEGIVELRAAQDGVISVIDTLQFSISKIGDTNGDGTVTSADALYITKLVNAGTIPTVDELNKLDINRDGLLDKADASTLLSKYVGKTGAAASSYVVNIKEVNDAPIAYNTQITGMPAVGQTLLGSYAYYDVENDTENTTKKQWYRGKKEDGSDRASIAGASESSYTVTEDDTAYYLFFEVTPSAASGVPYGKVSFATTIAPVPDTKPPEVITLMPMNSSMTTIEAMSAPFQIEFNEDVKAGTGTILLHKGSSEVACTMTISGKTVTIDHSALEDVTAYYITIPPGAIQDLAGNSFAGLTSTTDWSFTTPDKTPPHLSSLNPLNGEMHVGSGTNMTMNFSENVKAVSGKYVSIYKADGTPVASYEATDTQVVTIGSSSVTLTQAVLEESQSYYVNVEPGAFTDMVGNPFAGITTPSDWAFTVPDITSPTLMIKEPAHQSINVSLAGDLSLTWSEAVVPVSGKTITIFDAATNSAAAELSVIDSSQVEITGQVVTLKHPNLEPNASYYVDVPTGAFKDFAGNDTSPLSGLASWSFSTPDTIPPVLNALSPLASGVLASKSTDFTMTFSENVTAVVGKKIKLYKVTGSGSDLVESYATDDTTSVTVNGNLVTIHHADLEEKASYEVKVEAGAFEDQSHNAFAGLTQSTDWTFTVPDVTAPTVATAAPLDGAVNVSLTHDFTLTFSEDVIASSSKKIYVRKQSDYSAIATYAANDTDNVTVNGPIVTIHNPGLQNENKYEIEVESGAFIDIAGNPFAGLTASEGWSFTTPDTNPPVVVQTSPANAAVVRDPNADWIVTFHEPVSLISGKHITIQKLSETGSSEVASYNVEDTTHIIVSGASVTIKHDALDLNTTYAVDIESGAFTDSAGNPFVGLTGSNSWTFKSNAQRTITAVNLEPFTEKQLNADAGAIVDITITEDKFAATLDKDDFQLNNAPVGLKISDVIWYSETEVFLVLDFDGSDFDVNADNFNVTVKGAALDSEIDINTDNMPITATVETEVPVFLSEYLFGGGSQVGIEIFNTGTAVSGYTLKVYQYYGGAVHPTSYFMQNEFAQQFVFNTGVPALAIDGTFYDLFDVSNKYYYRNINEGDPEAVPYYNFELPISPGAPITAIELIKNGTVVDVIGDPDLSNTKALLVAGKTMRRKAAIHMSSSMYKPLQWDWYSKSDLINEKFYQGLARHTVTP